MKLVIEIEAYSSEGEPDVVKNGLLALRDGILMILEFAEFGSASSKIEKDG